MVNILHVDGSETSRTHDSVNKQTASDACPALLIHTRMDHHKLPILFKGHERMQLTRPKD